MIPADRVADILDNLRALRYMDENLYLRSGMLNIFNGLVGLTFSCDGSHYMPWDELLEKDLAFWVGKALEAGEGCRAQPEAMPVQTRARPAA